MIRLIKLFEKVHPRGISDDSRKVEKGFIFVAIKGDHVDGHKFIPQAIEKGAVAIVSDRAPEKEWLEKIIYQRVKYTRKALAFLASQFYGNPSKKLKVIGVTGSDGKTTTSHMIYEILKNGGKKVGLISTIVARIGDNEIDTGFHVTNPEPLELHKFLDEMVKSGLEYVVLETTSHGIHQDRVYGIKYDISVLTNITHEHIDYHKTFENYRDTKLKMFLKSRISILNKDDNNYSYFNEKVKNKKITYSINQIADFYAEKILINDFMTFSVRDGRSIYEIKTKLLGKYNAQNALAAIATARQIGVKWSSIKKALLKMNNPKGRLEKIENDKGLNIFIDFAHTPNALKEVLTLLKDSSKGKLITVFGCAGERDVEKRPMMAQIATSIADVSIFTAEDPRSEKIDEILIQMEKGVGKGSNKHLSIPERGEAITHALNKLAQKGDTIVICGKAHERSMAYNGIEYPWSDFQAVEYALQGMELKINRKL